MAPKTISRQAVRQRADGFLGTARQETPTPEDVTTDAQVAALNETAAQMRAPVREAARREELPPGAALGRHGEVLMRKRRSMDDRFYIPPELKDPGWSYEWKRLTFLNKEDTAHQVHLAENGWRPVMAEGRWAGIFMPNGYVGAIERDGMILMERPESLTSDAYAEEREKARSLMRSSNQSLGFATPTGFTTKHAGVQPKLSQSYELGPAPAKRPLLSD